VLGQAVVVDNRAGATGTIGAGIVAKAAPDGYTLLLGTSNELAMSPGLYDKLPYDPARDFAPVTTIIVFPNILVVNPALPVKNVKALIALAKARPGQLSFASSGNGSTNHLTAEIFKSLARIDINHVPYKGGGPALVDVMGGQVEAMFATIPSAVGHVRGGKLKALLVTSDLRAAALPQVPSSPEAGLAGFVVSTWNGVLAPAGTPREIIARLHAEIVNLAYTPDMQSRMEAVAAEIHTTSPEEFSALIRRDFARWSKVIADANIRVE
jgi:tripartite-type tricarboxylate transporter receptor subunit TctC